MKKNTYISLGACLLLCGITAAESWASSEEEIQKNLNQLIATRKCSGCDLREAVLTRMDLRGADLQGADLSGAKLSLTNLSKADLKNAVLRNAVLGGTDFAGADLRGVDFTGAQLAGAYLKEAILDKELIQSTPSEPEAQALPEERNEGRTEELASTPREVDLSEPVSSEAGEDVSALEVAVASMEQVTEEEIHQEDEEKVADQSASVSAVSEQANTSEDPEEVIVESVATEPLAILQQEEKKKDAVALPEIERRTATTVRSKDLVPLQEIQQIETVEEEEQLAVTQEEETTEVLPDVESEKDEIPVVPPEIAREEKQSAPQPDAAAAQKEHGLWNKMNSLFGSEDEKKAEADSKDGEEQARAYTVETFAQSQIRLRSLVETLLEKRRCVACNLAGADLRGKDLEEVDLERADLSGAQLEEVDLRASNLKGVNFIDANLRNADLREADLYRADFTNADLTGARLDKALLDSADFTGTIGRQDQEAE
jgi:uncharacterized protein YjbI with pentapeptide repeats